MKNNNFLNFFAILLFIGYLVGCHRTDFGVQGATYVRHDAPFRHFSTLSKVKKDKDVYTLYVRGKSPNPEKFILRKGHLYILNSYGDEKGGLKFFYPSFSDLVKIKASFKGLKNPNAPCAGIDWLKKDAPTHISQNEDFEIYEWEKNYKKMSMILQNFSVMKKVISRIYFKNVSTR